MNKIKIWWKTFRSWFSKSIKLANDMNRSMDALEKWSKQESMIEHFAMIDGYSYCLTARGEILGSANQTVWGVADQAKNAPNQRAMVKKYFKASIAEISEMNSIMTDIVRINASAMKIARRTVGRENKYLVMRAAMKDINDAITKFKEVH